jgi:hypothetical protein
LVPRRRQKRTSAPGAAAAAAATTQARATAESFEPLSRRRHLSRTSSIDEKDSRSMGLRLSEATLSSPSPGEALLCIVTPLGRHLRTDNPSEKGPTTPDSETDKTTSKENGAPCCSPRGPCCCGLGLHRPRGHEVRFPCHEFAHRRPLAAQRGPGFPGENTSRLVGLPLDPPRGVSRVKFPPHGLTVPAQAHVAPLLGLLPCCPHGRPRSRREFPPPDASTGPVCTRARQATPRTGFLWKGR